MSAAVAPAPAEVQRPLQTIHREPRSLWVALAIVLAVAAFTRLWHLDLIDFKADEAQIAGLAMDVAEGSWPVTSIQTSGGIFNPPLPVYFFGLAALFTRDPAWQAAVIGSLDVLGVLAVFLIGRRYFCGRVGLAAAGFYAANAYATIFARKLAGPFLQPLFAALLLACLLECSRFRAQGSAFPDRPRTQNPEPRTHAWLWTAAILLLAILVQFHLGALLLAPVLAILFLLSRPTWRAVAYAGGGLLLGIMLFLPYLAYEFSHQPKFLPSLFGAGGTPGWGLGAFRLIWVTITSPGYGDLTGSAFSTFNAESWPAGVVTPLAGIAALGGLYLASRRWRDRRYLTLLVFTLLPLFLMLHNDSAVRIHYFVFLEPAIFLLAGIGFDSLLAVWPRLRGLAFALLGVLLAAQTGNLAHFAAFIQQHQLPGDGYGLPLAYQARLFNQARRFGASQRIVTAVDGRDQADPASYFLRGKQHVEVDASRGLLLPVDAGAYVTFGQKTPPTVALSQALVPAHTETFPGGTQALLYLTTSVVPPQLRQALSIRTSQPASWRDGLSLTGITAPHELSDPFAAEWHIATAVDPSTVFFNQLIDDSGKQWFDDDSVPVSAAAWQAGDSLFSVTPVKLPGDAPLQEYWWVVGVYEAGGRRVPLANGETQLRVARVKGGTPQPSNVVYKPADATFDSAIQLTGYAVDSSGVSLRWASLGAVTTDYTVFVHAVDASGKLLAQADSPPSEGHYPTSLWDAGESIVDHHALPDLRDAHLEVGLYDLANGQRLKLPDGSDHVILPVT